jgi:hypothetical protein
MGESLQAALRGLQVSLHDLAGTADYLGALADHWDDHVGSYIGKHIEPAMAKLRDETFQNPHGRFDEATNLKYDIEGAQDKLARRITSVSTLLHDLQQITAQIADNYQVTELSNQADQKKLLALIDSGTADPAHRTESGATP